MRADDRCRALPVATLPLLLGACASGGGTLDALQQAYGEESVAAMEPPLASTLLLAGLAVDLCLSASSGAWDGADPGEPPPLDPELQLALGEPLVATVQTLPNLDASLLEVGLMGRSDAALQVTTSAGSPFLVTGAVQDGPDGEPLGTFSYSVIGGCTTAFARLTGSASWTDDAGLEHAIHLPADETGDEGVDLPGTTVWLPAAGSVSWQARIDEELRSFVSDDASGIEPYGAGGRWSGVVSGLDGQNDTNPNWSVDVVADLQPQ